MSLRKLINLVETFLVEDALTKGSQQVIKNSNLVTNLADAVRDDAMAHPQNFPAGFSRAAMKKSDEDLARWFLEQLDRIEREGYGGAQYSRDGVNNLWIVNRYIAGSHNWEDIQGTMAMNLSKWYFLKNRNMLDQAHTNIPKFSSIRDIGQYMVYHYEEALRDLEEKLKAQALKKSVRAIKLVDNEDYKIYIIMNRAASVMYGLGSNWCTANSNYAGHYHSYAGKAMLFQLYPKQAEEVEVSTAGKVFKGAERYQFDAGGPNFMNLADRPANPAYIQEKYPYLYYDLSKALKEKKSEIEEYIKQSEQDTTLTTDDTKVKSYNLDDEIKKLEKFKTQGYFTDKKRPPPKKEEPEADQPPA